MRKVYLIALALSLSLLANQAQAWPVRFGIGIGIGVPIGGYYRPYPYYPPYYSYPYAAPYPYYSYPPPTVVVQPPPPTTVQVADTPPSSQPVYVASPPSSYSTMPPAAGPSPGPIMPAVVSYNRSGIDTLLQKLTQTDENVRRDAAMDLGRMKATQAIDTLSAMLANDASPVVRDAAARALGLIGASRSLNALIRAAQADNDRDVRHSAQFAIEVIRSQMQR